VRLLRSRTVRWFDWDGVEESWDAAAVAVVAAVLGDVVLGGSMLVGEVMEGCWRRMRASVWDQYEV
jgi:hypothetical protein